jgi:hypothetical protein
MLDTTTLNAFNALSKDQLATKLAVIEQIMYGLHLDIISNEDYENMSLETELALTKLSNDLHQAVYNKDLY